MNEQQKRSDSQEREHICGCGKSYLSYSALQNHARIKHKSVFPQNTVSSQLNIVPVKNIKKINKFKTHGVNRKIHAFRNKIKIFNGKILQDNDTFDYDFNEFLKNTIKIYKQNSLIYTVDIEDTFDKLLKKERINSKDLKNIYEVFAYFVYDCKKNCSKNLMQDLFLFIYFLVLIFNVRGWYYFQKKNKLDEQPDMQYCQSGAIEILPKIINRFTTNLYPYLIDRLQDINFPMYYLGLQKNQIENMLFIVMYFTEWLYLKGFIGYQLQLSLKIKKNNQILHYRFYYCKSFNVLLYQHKTFFLHFSKFFIFVQQIKLL